MTGQKITPFLWFDNQAEEAAKCYVGVVPNSNVFKAMRYGATGPGPPGSVFGGTNQGTDP